MLILTLRDFILLLHFLQLCSQIFGLQNEQNEPEINPLNVGQEAVGDKARNSRWDWGFKKKPAPVEQIVAPPSEEFSAGSSSGSRPYGIKTSYSSLHGMPSGGSYSSYSKTSGYNSAPVSHGFGGGNSGSGFGSYSSGGYGGGSSSSSYSSKSYHSSSSSSADGSGGLLAKYTKLIGIGGDGGGSAAGHPHIPAGASYEVSQTADYLTNGRQQILIFGGCAHYPLPGNVIYKCAGDQCEVKCPSGNAFPGRASSIKLACVGGSWMALDPMYENAVPPCQAVCLPPCQNNGICLDAGHCKCPENYYGPYCENKKSICASNPPIPKNSKVKCMAGTCNAECMRGFQFPDGSTITNLQCQDGHWIHTKSGLVKPPDCQPICEPQCLNGGQCISFNVCQCSRLHRGNHCQYSVSACNVTSTDFNGMYKCSFDNEEAKCRFSCPTVQHVKVKGNLNIDYTCKYSEGKYMPQPLPSCIYPPGYKVTSSSLTTHYTQTHGAVIGGGGIRHGVQYSTEHERIMAILEKFRTYDMKSEWWSSEEMYVTPNSYSLYMSGEVDVMVDRTPKPSICTTWGGNNMKTFDGLIYKAPLSCSHTLVADTVDATFDITLQACPFGSGYGCAHALKLYWQSVPYTIENLNGTIRLSTPTKNLPIPVQMMGMKVLPVAQHIQIDLESVGLKLNWDHHQYVGVHAGPALWSKVGGLCGTLDGDYKNDLMSKHGKVQNTVKAFVDSWRVDDNSELCVMDNSAELEFGSETCDPTKRKKAVEVCERLLANEKLEECIKSFNFEALLRSCVDNYCNCPNRDRPETCTCDDVSMLAKECTFRGVKLEHGWRNLEICPISCSYGRIYLPCGPEFEPTCDSAVMPTKGKCNEGCFCPEGTVQYKEACITPELCPCTMGGREFKPESIIKKHCNTCTCKNGQWKCTDEKCGARCGAIGDPHYQTFDGKRYDFMGKCSYYLLKTQNMSVEAENVACSGAVSENMNIAVTSENPSCTKSVTIRTVLKNGVATSIKLGQGLSVHVNNKEVLKFPKILGAGEILIRQASSTFMTVEFPGGIRVWWDGVSRAYIDAPPKYRGETSGLCGTFNSNTQDDFLTPEGDIETTIEPFADKWRTKDTCDFLAETTTAGPHPCSVNKDKRAEAEKYCAWITEDIFQDCHWTVEPEQYYEDCLYDVCACKDDLSKCFCPILAAYGTECMRQGIKTGWRMAVKECAVKCPFGQVYDECGDNCALTCQDLPSKNTCQRECVEGCRCPHGEYLNEQGECVPEHKCPCMYDGMTFMPGYKEVRPGKKFEDLCTCEKGVWDCQDAEPGDKEKYPPSSELRAKCNKLAYTQFSKCAPKEPKTCKNMHEYSEDLEDCKPDCVCKPEYVYDMSVKACVLPESCSCHHGGKSFNDGEKMKEDCNICVCKSGNWECSSQGCESTCSVWGDSHFNTFDNHEYDFQGECDYILSKGVAANGDGFTITIQNVLCGTMGVTCSKSLEISLTGSAEDTLKLSTDSAYLSDPDKTTIRRVREAANAKGSGAFHIYKAGVFIIVEVIPLKLQIKWDEGTRVYVKLGNEWKNKVAGLCGNYNDNSRDDMQTPSQASETSPLIFGHSWKTQQFCAMPKQPIDACKVHPERETWAQLKCGVLKSQLFKDCHSEVPVEKYLKRCIFDTCACDQGGDCECLCTAIAAYAHDCSQKGVNIRWRTPHLCPMQCDPHCAEYKACTPACAVETCDNFLDQGISERICNKENCIEGCHIKPCEEGMIYLNDSYRECVPKSECKPICMVKDGVTFYEGDVTYMDDCSTCRCSKKKEVCSGVKCIEKGTTRSPYEDGSTLRPSNTEPEAKCVRGWTRWFDEDDDTSNKLVRLNDEEKLPRYDRMEQIYGTCLKKYMKKIECRVVKTHEKAEYMDEQVKCSLQTGLACIGQCHDYEIRVFCQCDEQEMTTLPPSENLIEIGKPCDAVVLQYKEYPGDCHKFLQCTPKDVGGEWTYVEKTCGDTMMFNPTMNICDHIATVQELKPNCGSARLEVEEIVPSCPPGMIMSECANQCEHTCHYYAAILQKRGLCKKGEHCKPGCVPGETPNCPQLGKYWRDKDTCVESDECPCMDQAENYIQPHMPVVGEWETCQCIENAFVCVPNKIETVTKKPEVEVQKVKIYDVFPTTVTPPVHCNPELLVPMIQGYHRLPDTVFNASSSLGPAYLPHKARLNTEAEKHTGSWSPSINDQMQYLEVKFEQEQPLFGVIMAGNPEFDNYVTLFKILYSHDGEAYHYLVDETDMPQLFNGPLDSRKPIKTMFKIPIEAKSVRVYPLKWHNSIAMRVELLGCGEPSTTTPQPYYTDIIVTTVEPMTRHFTTDCTDEMGVTNGQMAPVQVSSSEMWKLPHPAKKPELIDLLKLSSPIGWRPLVNSPKEYVEFDFLEPRNISGFITKGGPDGYVTSYKVAFSRNKKIWNKVLNVDGRPRAFTANHDAESEALTQFRTPLLTQFLRVLPEKWEGNINMRIEPVGCFTPYPLVKENIVEVDKPITKCHICQGVVDATQTSGQCKCKEGLFWDGNTCVQSSLCPCVEDYITYAIGSKFENKVCEDCVCLLGGQPSCKPKKCPKCEGKNLRPIMASGCYCKCEPCPVHQKLCPSSGDCIPEILWCNGIQDCGDDEDETCVHTVTVSPTQFKNKTETVTITCPKPECPPQMKVKIIEKKRRQMSEMFSSTVSKKFTITHDGDKVTRTKVITAVEEFLPMPNEQVDFVQEEECAEFLCAPDPTVVVKINETFACIDPKCPENYDVDVDMSVASKPGDCKKYTCVLRPKKDDVCEISGKSFTTFDGTEYKYDTCSHILARDIVNASWIISTHLHCEDETRKICRKMITIKDIESAATLTIMPNMKLNFNGFDYTVPQLINSPICKASFVISQLGNTVLVVSRKHGYWVAYDDIGYVKVGISSKYINTVDGLCGYYNGNPSDDKRAPDGAIMPNTLKFGDSWFDKKIPKEQCYPQTCPFNLQKKALALCNNVKHPTFLKCGKSVNYKQFSVKCIETTCECLRLNNGDASACKCAILQDFVKKCLAVNPNVQLDTWRAVHQCEIACPSPLVHSDCYKRRCEPSCDTLHDDECPIIPDACFSGCYCPEGTVRKGETCVPVVECRDCVCDSFGTSKYFTYDRNSFTFNGNCTYLLSRDIVLPGVHTFQVYVTMDDCKKLGHLNAAPHSSCAKSLHVLNGDHVIHIQRLLHNPNALQIFVDGFEVKRMPYKDSWITLREVNGKQIILGLPNSHVELTAAFDDLVFSLAVPSIKYGSKMEGLCGDCNGDPNNDLVINPNNKKIKKSSKALVDVIKSWQADEPKLGLDANECLSEEPIKEDCIPLPPEKDPCMLFYNENIFGKCNIIIDPFVYVTACQQDMCKPGGDQKGACDAFSAYAKDCAKQGICLHWRSPTLCPYDCPSDMKYEPCGCAKTCDKIKAMSDFEAINMNTNTIVKTVSVEDMCPVEERFEGCFCPSNKIMDHGKCVDEEACVKCDDLEHKPGEKWQKDKCTTCTCNKDGKTECVETNCQIEENICAEGYQPKKIITPDECCPRYVCVPEIKSENLVKCLEPLMPHCGPGQFKKQKKDANGCPQYICECKPKEECEPLKPPRALLAGEKLITDETGCCPSQQIICDQFACPKRPETCAERFHELNTKQGPEDCCPTYICAPPKDKCIVQYGLDVEQAFLKPVNEKWTRTDEPCKHDLCAYGPNGSTQIATTIETCDTQCLPGFSYVNTAPTIKCCGECKQTECVFESKLYKPDAEWKSADNCTSYHCAPKGDQLIVSSLKEACPDVSSCPKHLLVENEGCCKYCKTEPPALDKSNCLPVSLAETETVKLIKYEKPGHGLCVNKAPIKGFTECVGACDSGSKYNPVTFMHDNLCHCCNIKSYKSISIPLMCEDGTQITKELDIPASCGCSPCAESAQYQTTDNQYDIRLHPLPLAEMIQSMNN